ncbi:MAG: copper chaperone PCu(A)C [Rhodospirillales bacterium]|nr:copper chaperone PCu(A)C [Rhodospirillales bacterium]
MKKALLIASTMFITTPAFADDHKHNEQEEHHLSESSALRFIHAWSRETSGEEALVFVEIENTTDRDVMITGAETHIAADVSVVGFQMQSGDGAYVPIGELVVPAGAEMDLAPEALAFKLSGLKEPLEHGAHFEMHVLSDGEEIEIDVEIEEADAHQHSHAGHQH